MKRTYLKDLKNYLGQEVIINGFIQVIRDQGGIKFLILRDITGLVQIVILKAEKEVFDLVKDLTLESVVTIEGLVKEEKQAPGGFEVQAKKIIVLSKAEPEIPIPILEEKGGDDTEVSKRLDWRWLDLRKPEKEQIFKLWTEFERGFRDYFEKNGYIQLYSPSIMGTSSESGSQVFEVKYFDRKAYLSQSPQFYKQMAMASGFEKVFMIGPVFRAEPSYTTRHVTEFTGFDFEISYIDSHHDIMVEEEKMIVETFKRLKEKFTLDIDTPSVPFPKITLEEAKKKLKAKGIRSEKNFDVSSEEEIEICKIIKEETEHDFVFLTDWPIEGRPFYHMRHEDNPGLTKSFDLLYRGIEVTTGAQREHRVDVLTKQALEIGMDLEPLTDYINFFRYGCPPHGGIGMGPARFIMKMLGLPSIKEAIFLPRDVKRLRP